MLAEFLSQYWTSILVGLGVLALVGLIVYFSFFRKKKTGKGGGCGCGCAGCPMSEKCHK